MNCFITGLPGAGKGVYSTMRCIDVLMSSEKPIITNFALELYPWLRQMARRRSRGEKGLLAHLRDTYGETFNAEKRVHVLTDEQMADFYTWRVDEHENLIQVEHTRDKAGRVATLNENAFATTLPCYYLMDEGWKFLNARGWQKLGEGFQFYLAQHRKAGDDLDITAQDASQIDKQARVLVQEYHTLVNHGYRKIGVFKQPNVISVVVSNEPPDKRKSVGAMPKMIRFDKVGIGGSFNTAKGAGITGMAGDIERKRKGWPTWGMPVAAVAVGLVIVLGSRLFGGFAGALLSGGKKKDVVKEGGQVVETNGMGKVTEAAKVGIPRSALEAAASVTRTSLYPESELTIVGWAYFGGLDRVMLSDGTTVTYGDGRCTAVRQVQRIAVVDGKMVQWQKPVKAKEQRERRTYQGTYPKVQPVDGPHFSF